MSSRWAIASLIAGCAIALTAWTARPRTAEPAPSRAVRVFPATAARRVYDRGLDSLGARLGALAAAIDRSDSTAAITAFRSARVAYKRIEGLLETYAPGHAGRLNGPMPEQEDGSGALGAPAGFQIIEAAVFEGESPGPDSLRATLAVMRRSVAELGPLTKFADTRLPAALDMARVEIARVSVLGLAGFDAGASGDAVREAATALHGSAILIAAAGRESESPGVPWRAAATLLGEAAGYLRANPDFETLDRLEFVARYANPAAHAVAAARAMLPGVESRHRLWRDRAATLFDADAFDPTAGAPRDEPPSADQIALGRRLFNDPRLSGPGTRSCASCHDEKHAFADRRPTSPLLGKHTGPVRNTPTLINAALQRRLFMDQRAGTIEDQIRMVLASASEMGGSNEQLAARLRGDTLYRALFQTPRENASQAEAVGAAVREALGAYVRSLTALNSRFDRAVRGDMAALSPAERRGFTVFMGKARCGTCHFAPLFNGTLPPWYEESEPEIIGVPTRPAIRRARLDSDPGVSGADKQVQAGAFRVPTVRNITLTAPYMHHGTFRTLEQVIDFYNRGGGAGIGAHVEGQTLPAAKLELTVLERRALIAFMGALVDTTLTRR
jgi:cytochrome c peroxidase